MIHLVVRMLLLVLTHILCLAAMTERKYSLWRTVLIYTAFGLLFVGLTTVVSLLFGGSSVYMTLIAFAGTILMSFFVFILTSADPVCKKVFLFISHANLFCIFFCLSVLLCGAWFPHFSETGVLYVRSIMRTLLYVSAIWVYLKYLRPYIRTVPGTRKKTWYSLSLVSVLFMIIFALFVTVFYTNYTGQYIFLFAAVAVIYCSVLWIMFGTIRYMSDESKMELVEKNVEYLQGQLALARENELYAKTIRHDFRHHNQNLAILLKKGDIKKALCYIEQYNESIDAAKPREICPHATVNAILNNFCIKAQKNGISVAVSADTPEESAIADMDFVAILSNLLENALNGCLECEARGEIQVHLRTVADKMVIVCSNPCRAGIVIENNMIKPKGIGINSVVLAAKKYDGDINYSMENGNLTVCVILNN